MNKTKKFLLMVFALIAIVSCSSSSKIDSNGTIDKVATKFERHEFGWVDDTSYLNGFVPSRSTTPRFTSIDFSPFQAQGKFNKYNGTFIGEQVNLDTGNVNTSKTHYDVKDDELGFSLNSLSCERNSCFLNIASPTTMDVHSGGVAINLVDNNNEDELHHEFSSTPKEFIKNYFNYHMKNGNNLTLNMDPGSTLFFITGIEQNLSGISNLSFSDIYDTSDNSFPKINGTNFNLVAFHDVEILIDQDVNLDNPNDPYNQLVAISSEFDLDMNKKIIGTKDNQIGIKNENSRFQNKYSSVNPFNRNDGLISLKGNNSIGVLAMHIGFENLGKISVGNNSVGIYWTSDTINGVKQENFGSVIKNGGPNTGVIEIGENSIGIFVNSKKDENMFVHKIINSAFVLNEGAIRSISNNAIGIALKGDVDFTFNGGGGAANKREITLLGDKSIGIYASGTGNYTITNEKDYPNNGEVKIKIGDSFDKYNPSIGIYSDNPKANLINKANIEIGKNSIGMAGIGTLINDNNGIIKITKDGGVGMYLGKDAIGVNNGLITTEGTPNDAVGVVVGKDAEFTNNGTIHIDSNGGAGIVIAGGTVKNYGNIEISGGAVRDRVDNSYQVTVQSSDRKLLSSDMKVYVDSLGRTKPIEGLANLGLKSADLLIGAEATEKTNDTEVTVGDDVLAPFNNSMQTSNIKNWNVKTGSLVWQANPEILNNKIAKVTLKKLSYASFADDEMTQDVARGLDEKYKVANSNDKEIFNYLNTVNSKKTFADTYREISGNQYANVQQRISKTDDILNNRISDLQKENADESGHHVSTFFDKNKHSSKVQGIADSDSSAYGISYLFNNADAKQGIYAGAINNNFKLKDNGRSKENISMLEVGGYKTFDVNNLEWTLDGNGFVSQNNMKRRFVVGNSSYENKANYNAYGVNLTNKLGKTFNVGGNFTVKPYAALKLGYGRFNKIKEKDGTLNVEVKANDYYSVRPGAGVEFGFSSPVSAKGTKFKASLGLGYDHELGKVDDRVNEVKFTDTNTRIRLKSAKDEKKGNFRSDLKVGFETGKFDVSVNGGYDTKDKNSHVGVGLGVSF